MGGRVVLPEISLSQLLQELFGNDTVVLRVRLEVHVRFIIEVQF